MPGGRSRCLRSPISGWTLTRGRDARALIRDRSGWRASPVEGPVMWIRRCEIDAELEAPLPLPTQVVSNEEFIPPPQSKEQQRVEARALEIAAAESRRRGVSRRQFL